MTCYDFVASSCAIWYFDNDNYNKRVNRQVYLEYVFRFWCHVIVSRNMLSRIEVIFLGDELLKQVGIFVHVNWCGSK